MSKNINPLLQKIIPELLPASVSEVTSSKSHNKSPRHKTHLRKKIVTLHKDIKLSILMILSLLWLLPKFAHRFPIESDRRVKLRSWDPEATSLKCQWLNSQSKFLQWFKYLRDGNSDHDLCTSYICTSYNQNSSILKVADLSNFLKVTADEKVVRPPVL